VGIAYEVGTTYELAMTYDVGRASTRAVGAQSTVSR
jgi:hypothetical protein